MSKHVYIHIGLPKTGTSFLQHKLQINAEKLKEIGVYIPKTGLNPVLYDYNFLALALQPDRWSELNPQLLSKIPNLWSELIVEIDRCPCPIIFLSAETLSWELNTEEQLRMISESLSMFKVSIVFCERDPYDFIASIYGHILRTGRGPYSLESFLLEFPYYWSPHLQKLRWSKFFGKQNFIILTYEKLKGDFLFENFFSTLLPEQSFLLEKFKCQTVINRNKSFSPRFLRFLEELSANNIDINPYIHLYQQTEFNLLQLESDIVRRSDIDKALNDCGMRIDYYELNANHNLIQAKKHQKKSNKSLCTPNLTSVNQELLILRHTLVSSKTILEQTTEELVVTRQTLAERTALFEQTGKDLEARTEELALTRHTLAERTALFEQTSKDLAERTEELVVNRQTLAERTTLFEQTSKDLAERTEELVVNRQTLAERTALFEQTAKDLKDRTEELALNRHTLAERTALFEQTSKDLKDRTEELVLNRHTLAERTILFEQTSKDLAKRDEELDQINLVYTEIKKTPLRFAIKLTFPTIFKKTT